MAGIHGDYSLTEETTPEAIRDRLQMSVTALVSQLMEENENPTATGDSKEEGNGGEETQQLQTESETQVAEEEDSALEDEEDDQSVHTEYTYSNTEISASMADLSL